MRRLLAAATAAIAVAAALAGCGESATPVVGDAAGTLAAAHVDRHTGGSGTVNWEWELPTSWDPVTSTAGWDVHVLSLVYASVTRLDPNGSAGPGLAQSWRYTHGGRDVTFVLRPGLRFEDGSPVTAAAVKENIERGLHQANSTVASELDVIDRVTTEGRRRFTLHLAEVDYQVPALLGGKTGMIVSPEALRHPSAIPTHPDGAGPFTLSSYVPDSHADLTRNPGYWDARQIHLAHLTVQDITNPQEILAALESGQVNVAYIPGDLVAAARRAGFRILDIPSEVVTEIDTQTTTPPLNDPRIVEAINLAIDRESLVRVQQAGFGVPAYQPFPRGYVGYSAKLADEYPYDPARARALVKAAGRVGRIPITLTNGLGPVDDSLAEQLQSQLTAVGLRVRIADVPAATLTQALYVAKTIPFALDQTAGRESPIEMLDVLYDQKGLMNVDGRSAKESATVADALQRTLRVPLGSPRYPATLQSSVSTAVRDDPIHIWLFTTPRILAVSPHVHGIPFDLVQQRWEGVTVSR